MLDETDLQAIRERLVQNLATWPLTPWPHN
jgi:hypothetical protein